jgi:hypothetical protein
MLKVFADRQTDRRTGQKLYGPDLSIREHKNPTNCNILKIFLRLKGVTLANMIQSQPNKTKTTFQFYTCKDSYKVWKTEKFF